MAKKMLRFVFRSFFKRHDLESELNEELASHIAMETAARVREGVVARVHFAAAQFEAGQAEVRGDLTYFRCFRHRRSSCRSCRSGPRRTGYALPLLTATADRGTGGRR